MTVFLVLGCGAKKPPQLADIPLYEQGLVAFPSPRQYDAPGTIFRIDPDGTRRNLVSLSGMIATVVGREAVPKITLSQSFNFSMLLSFLGENQVGTQIGDTGYTTIEVAGGQREFAYEVGLKALLDSANRIIDWHRPGKVYLISETVSADSVTFRLVRGFHPALRDSVAIKEAGAAVGTVRWDNTAQSSLSMRFDTPYRIFYKAYRLDRTDAVQGGGIPILLSPAQPKWAMEAPDRLQ